MSFRDLVRLVVDPDLDDEACDYILWEQTPFPLVQGVLDLLPYLLPLRDERCLKAGVSSAASVSTD